MRGSVDRKEKVQVVRLGTEKLSYSGGIGTRRATSILKKFCAERTIPNSAEPENVDTCGAERVEDIDVNLWFEDYDMDLEQTEERKKNPLEKYPRVG